MLTGPNAYETGMGLRRRMTGARGEEILRAVSEVSPELADYMVEYVYGTVYARPGLDLKTRSLCTMSALIALGRMTQLRAHVGHALRLGVSGEEILEVILQMQIYAGLPAAIDALKVATEVFKEAQGQGAT